MTLPANLPGGSFCCTQRKAMMISNKVEFHLWVGEYQIVIDTEDLGRISRYQWKATEDHEGRPRFYRELPGIDGLEGSYELLEHFVMRQPDTATIQHRESPLDFRKASLAVTQ